MPGWWHLHWRGKRRGQTLRSAPAWAWLDLYAPESTYTALGENILPNTTTRHGNRKTAEKAARMGEAPSGTGLSRGNYF